MSLRPEPTAATHAPSSARLQHGLEVGVRLPGFSGKKTTPRKSPPPPPPPPPGASPDIKELQRQMAEVNRRLSSIESAMRSEKQRVDNHANQLGHLYAMNLDSNLRELSKRISDLDKKDRR